MRYSLGEISDVLGGELVPPDASAREVRGVSVDSRTIGRGELFFALLGRRDGHDFVSDAEARGACGAVVQRKVDAKLPQIIVPNTLEALGKLAKFHRDAVDPLVVGVTGSVGKTTTRDAIAAALAKRFQVHSAKLNYNNLIGLPLTLLGMCDRVEVAVVELGINCPGEMERLSRISQPDVGVITAIAPVHTEGLGDLGEILAEKLRIRTAMSPTSPLVLNVDSPQLADVAPELAAERPVVTYAAEREADFRAEDIRFSEGRPSFTVRGVRFELKLLGMGAVYAALAAAAVGNYLNLPLDLVAEALSELEPRPHRLQLKRVGDVVVVDDTYNSSPAALQEALRVLESIDAPRRFAVLGDMLELGEFSERYHRQVAGMLLEHDVDGALLFGKLMRFAFDEAKRVGYGGNLFYTESFSEALGRLREMLVPPCAVLVKGSRATRTERFVEEILRWFG